MSKAAKKSTRQSKRLKRKRECKSEVDTEMNSELFNGLAVDDGYIKIDENLIKRLKVPIDEKPVNENTSNKPNPFQEFPDFLDQLKNGTPLTLDMLDVYSECFHDNPMAQKMADMLGNFPIELLAMKYSQMKAENWDYNIKVSGLPKITNQESAGLCWMHAATNVLRYDIIRKFHLDPKFELSQSYLFFYDKIERCNVILESLWQLRYHDIRDPKVKLLTDPDSHGTLMSDGGMYGFFINLANKYGLVPKNVYGGSMNCRSTETMNKMLMTILLRMNLRIKDFKDDWNRNDFDQYKNECMATIYDVIVRFLGEPPKPNDVFDWTFKDANGDTQVINNLTPEKYYRIIAPNEECKITIIHDPRHPETHFVPSWVEYGLNMQGQVPLSLINLPLNVFKRVIYESLKNDEAVWFAADINNGFDIETKTLDIDRFDYEGVLGTPVEFNKGEMLETLASKPVHAMVFNGVDVEEKYDSVIRYKKWRVENSWGSGDMEHEPDSGFYRMIDSYFDKYVTMAVIDIKYFEQEEARSILKNANEGKHFTYKFTDAFGTVADCKHCKSK